MVAPFVPSDNTEEIPDSELKEEDEWEPFAEGLPKGELAARGRWTYRFSTFAELSSFAELTTFFSESTKFPKLPENWGDDRRCLSMPMML